MSAAPRHWRRADREIGDQIAGKGMFPIKVAQRAFLQLKTADGVGMVAEGFALLDILMTRLARAC